MSVIMAGNIAVQTNGQPVPISMGGTGQTTATGAINALLPTQTGNSGKVLTTNGTNVSWVTAGGSGSAGGSDTQIQFNDSGNFGGLPSLTINKTTGALTGTSSFQSQKSIISDVVTNFRTLSYQTSGLDRWLLQTNNSAENGTGLGSNFEFVRVADNGLTQNLVFTVARNTGIIDFKSTPTVNGVTIGSGAPTLTATQVAYGSSSNLMTSDSTFVWDTLNTKLTTAVVTQGFNTSTNAAFISTNALNDFLINPLDVVTSNPAGQFIIRGANNNGAFAAGTLQLKGGNNTNNGNAGSVTITAGNASGTSGTPGDVTITAGTSSNSSSGGNVTITPGTSSTGPAGVIAFGGAYTETTVNVTATSTTTLNCSLANIFNVTLGTTISSLVFSNVPATGRNYVITLYINYSGAFSITWPGSVKWASGTTPTATSVSGKVDIFTLVTHNGGTTWYGFVSGQNF